MRLNAEPFEMIESGRKTVELRLYDEKRKRLSVGDEILFISASDGAKKLLCEVVLLHTFPSFADLYSALPLLKCGYTEETFAVASPSDMRKYYSEEQERENGVVGIEIKLKNK